jgi:hypothetical protein
MKETKKTKEPETNQAASTGDALVTHGGPERQYKTCKCTRCGTVGKCTPQSDFFTLTAEPVGPLYCGRCICNPEVWKLNAEKMEAKENASNKI